MTDKAKKDENILAVSHGGWILCFLDYLVANSEKFELQNYVHEHPEKRIIWNTGRTKIEVGRIDPEENNNTNRRKLKFVHVHCIKHLENV